MSITDEIRAANHGVTLDRARGRALPSRHHDNDGLTPTQRAQITQPTAAAAIALRESKLGPMSCRAYVPPAPGSSYQHWWCTLTRNHAGRCVPPIEHADAHLPLEFSTTRTLANAVRSLRYRLGVQATDTREAMTDLEAEVAQTALWRHRAEQLAEVLLGMNKPPKGRSNQQQAVMDWARAHRTPTLLDDMDGIEGQQSLLDVA